MILKLIKIMLIRSLKIKKFETKEQFGQEIIYFYKNSRCLMKLLK